MAPALERHIVIVGHPIKPMHLDTFTDEEARKVEANKARRSRDKYTH